MSVENLSQWSSSRDGVVGQFAVTLGTAYLSFFVGEHVCKVSGILCTVTAAVVLAA